MDTLPIASGARATALLVDGAGHPVWPVRTQREMDLLASTAGRADAVLRMANSPSEHPEPVGNGSGAVASIEPGLEAEGRLYAHLTGRRFVAADESRRLPELEDLEIVVCSADAISSELLRDVYDRVRPVAPGLVYGRTPDELRAQVLRASAIARLKTRPDGTYVQLWPERGTGSAAERSWVTDAVALDASVLAVMTHSDGLDAPLAARGTGPGNLLICPVRTALDVDARRTPECRHSGWCYRLRMPFEAAFARGELLDPYAFRARVLVWSTCYGVLDSGAPLDRQWSLVHQLYLNPHVDVVLAKWHAAFGHGPFSEMMQGLALGVSVGEVVATFNATEGISVHGTQFAILGDPRVEAPIGELHPGMEAFYSPSRSTSERVDSYDDTGAHQHIELLRQCMKTPLRHSDEERDAAEARARFEQEYAEYRREGEDPQRLAELQHAALECLRRYTDVRRGWSPRVVLQMHASSAPCVHCGGLRTEAHNAFGSWCEPRRIGTCTRCQIVEDAPAEFELDFRVTEDRQLELVGEIPRGRFAGVLVLWSTTPLAGTVVRWPVTSGGRPLRRFALDAAWPLALARVTVWMMFDLQYLMLNHRVRGFDPHVGTVMQRVGLDRC